MLKCTKGRKAVRAWAGTLFQDPKLPLNLWYQIIWWFVGIQYYDRHKSYPTIVEKGYIREAMKKPNSWKNVDGNDDRLLLRVGCVAAYMKSWYLETAHGGMKITDVQPYLDEFVFRYNRRISKSYGLVFHRMIEASVKSKPKPN